MVTDGSRATSTTSATFALVGVTAVWGSTFVVVKHAIERMPVMDFLAWRFAIAALVMAVVRPRAVTALSPTARRNGVLLGLALAAGYVAQTFGLERTPATVSGFITGLFVVFTPLCAGVLLHKRIDVVSWLGVGVATAGLALLSLHGVSGGGGGGNTPLCALAVALHNGGAGGGAAGPGAHRPAGGQPT